MTWRRPAAKPPAGLRGAPSTGRAGSRARCWCCRRRNDHGEVDTLLGRIMDSEDGGERVRLFSELSNKLLPHLRAEQEILYARLGTGKE